MPVHKFVAKIADIKKVSEAANEHLPYIYFKSEIEGRKLKGDELTAILNVATTTSYIPVFLDKGKSIEDVDKEVSDAGAVLNRDSRAALKKLLESL